MPKPATFIALPMSINPRKWYLVYLVMLIYFKIVILSVTLQQSVTIYKLLRFRLLCQKVTLWVFTMMTIEEIRTGKEGQTFDLKSIQIDPKALAIPRPLNNLFNICTIIQL